jgi:hypothetical protein
MLELKGRKIEGKNNKNQAIVPVEGLGISLDIPVRNLPPGDGLT